jgi:hypothetical protein
MAPQKVLQLPSDFAATENPESVLSNPISNARLGENNTRVVGVLFDLLPELAYVDAQILRIFGMCRPPDRRENLLVGHYPAGVTGKKRQQSNSLGVSLSSAPARVARWRTESTSRLPTRNSEVSALRCMR